ncbi:hypothetical protein Pint_34258 [Pistacia integerrima]|uniref:Uncharacterized protein n=1 Tax=Pistacia integerrima TaxID=434235 RepID=A0ACC0X7B8_9ROSI|nr:hypothetical protein Pint_34258 [Pistacia integerrima]
MEGSPRPELFRKPPSWFFVPKSPTTISSKATKCSPISMHVFGGLSKLCSY